MEPRISIPSVTPTNDYVYTTPAAGEFGPWRRISGGATWYHIVTATGMVSIQFDGQSNPPITRPKGSSGRLPFKACQFRLATPTAQDVLISFGDVEDFHAPSAAGGDFPIPLPVIGSTGQGQEFGYTHKPDILITGMQQDLKDGHVTEYPLQTWDGEALLTGHVDTFVGFLVNAPSALAVKQYSTARISFSLVDPAVPLVFKDQFGVPLGYYKADGTFVSTGVVPGGYADGPIYVPLTAVTELQLASDSPNAWETRVSLSPMVFVP